MCRKPLIVETLELGFVLALSSLTLYGEHEFARMFWKAVSVGLLLSKVVG